MTTLSRSEQGAMPAAKQSLGGDCTQSIARVLAYMQKMLCLCSDFGVECPKEEALYDMYRVKGKGQEKSTYLRKCLRSFALPLGLEPRTP